MVGCIRGIVRDEMHLLQNVYTDKLFMMSTMFILCRIGIESSTLTEPQNRIVLYNIGTRLNIHCSKFEFEFCRKARGNSILSIFCTYCNENCRMVTVWLHTIICSHTTIALALLLLWHMTGGERVPRMIDTISLCGLMIYSQIIIG